MSLSRDQQLGIALGNLSRTRPAFVVLPFSLGVDAIRPLGPLAVKLLHQMAPPEHLSHTYTKEGELLVEWRYVHEFAEALEARAWAICAAGATVQWVAGHWARSHRR